MIMHKAGSMWDKPLWLELKLFLALFSSTAGKIED